MASTTVIRPTRSDLIIEFCKEIDQRLLAGHEEYGESASMIYEVLGKSAPAYAIMEKGLRYGRKGKPEDLVKAAAYAFLEWERVHANQR